MRISALALILIAGISSASCKKDQHGGPLPEHGGPLPEHGGPPSRHGGLGPEQGNGELMARVGHILRNQPTAEQLAQTEEWLKEAVKQNPRDSRAHLMLGRVLRHSWDIRRQNQINVTPSDSAQSQEIAARIMALFKEAVRITPENLEALLAYAGHLNTVGKNAEAILVYKEALKLNPDEYSINERIASCYLQLLRYQDARIYYRKVLKEKRSGEHAALLRGQSLEGLARIAQQEGKFKEAVKYYKLSIVEKPHGGPLACSYHALGQLYYGLGKFRKGTEAIIKGAELEPTKAIMQFRAALASFLNYDFAAASKYINRTQKYEDRKSVEAMNLKGFLLLLQQRYKKAEAMFNKARERSLGSKGAMVGLGHLAIIRKDYAAAQVALEFHTTRPPVESVGSHTYDYLVFQMAALGMAWTLSNQNKHLEAIKYFDRVLSINSSDIFSLLGKGSSLNALGRLDEGEAMFKKVLAQDPKNQYGLAELGLVKLNRGDTKGAESAFKAALASGAKGKYTCPHEGLGLVYLKRGKITRAKQSFEKAIAINPDIEYKKFNELAKIYIHQGKKARAEKLLEKSIQNYPYDPEAKRLLAELRGGKAPEAAGP